MLQNDSYDRDLNYTPSSILIHDWQNKYQHLTRENKFNEVAAVANVHGTAGAGSLESEQSK